MTAPAERADHMAETTNGVEGCIERAATNGVEHNIEAAALRVPCNILFDRLLVVVDRRGAEPGDESKTLRRTGREHLRSQRAGNLDGDMADPAGAAMDQNRLAGPEMSAVDEPFPGGYEDERQGGSLAHGQIGGLFRQQFGVDRGVFGE